MAVKETMAFIGDSGAISTGLLRRLAQNGYRLLFISEDVGRMEKLSQQLDLQDSNAEVEMLECAKDGCWEADIIAFMEPTQIGTELVKKIREVSTQKIILNIETTEHPGNCFSSTELDRLQNDFPFSKLVCIKVDTSAMKVQVYGEQQEAVESVSRIFESVGFDLNL